MQVKWRTHDSEHHLSVVKEEVDVFGYPKFIFTDYKVKPNIHSTSLAGRNTQLGGDCFHARMNTAFQQAWNLRLWQNVSEFWPAMGIPKRNYQMLIMNQKMLFLQAKRRSIGLDSKLIARSCHNCSAQSSFSSFLPLQLTVNSDFTKPWPNLHQRVV